MAFGETPFLSAAKMTDPDRSRMRKKNWKSEIRNPECRKKTEIRSPNLRQTLASIVLGLEISYELRCEWVEQATSLFRSATCRPEWEDTLRTSDVAIQNCVAVIPSGW